MKSRFKFTRPISLGYVCHNAFFTVFCLFYISASLPSQVLGDVSQAEKIYEYNFHVIYLDYKQKPSANTIELGTNLSFFNAGKVYRIAALAGSMSRGFNYTGLSNLVFYESFNNDEGEKEYRPLVTAQMGDSGTKLVIVSRDPNNRLYAFAYDIDNANFKKGELRIVNLSRKLVAARVGDVGQKIKPMATEDFPLKGKDKRYLVRLAIAAMVDGEFSVVENRRYAVSQDSRKLIVIHQKTNNPSELGYTSFLVKDETEIENNSDAELESLDLSEINDPSDTGENDGE